MPDGRQFVSSIESPNYPFYAVMFHPEKVLAMMHNIKGLNHSWMSIELNRYFADFFV
jgi:anthranilate/para-aminobenzoate synthase component II